MNYKMGIDKNGNKVVKIQPLISRGFSIQTNGNLPNTHRNHFPYEYEIIEWVKQHGTERQKDIMGVY